MSIGPQIKKSYFWNFSKSVFLLFSTLVKEFVILIANSDSACQNPPRDDFQRSANVKSVSSMKFSISTKNIEVSFLSFYLFLLVSESSNLSRKVLEAIFCSLAPVRSKSDVMGPTYGNVSDCFRNFEFSLFDPG